MEINDSTDRTAEICQKCGVIVDDYINTEKHPPVAYARQRGLEKANGEVVVSIDADMVCEGEKWLENLTKPLFENQNMVLTCGGIKHYDGKWLLMLNPIETILRKRKIYKSKEAIGVGFSNIAFKRDIALKIGGWPQTSISEDIGLIEKMIEVGKVKVVEKAIIRASGRRQMISLKEQFKQSKQGGNHFNDKEGKLKIVR
jgi:cellulose synthase/poly-beta-1,6-N-acetylglucosamine synthase-like glycosyltransferase